MTPGEDARHDGPGQTLLVHVVLFGHGYGHGHGHAELTTSAARAALTG